MANTGVIFDGTFEGFLTIVYKRYYEKLMPREIGLAGALQQTLGTDYVNVETDENMARKVTDGINAKLGGVIFGQAYMAFVNWDPSRYIHIFNYILLCFKYGAVAAGLTHVDCVIKTLHYARNSGHELQLLRGFTRFGETESGIMYADISPKNDLLPMLADFFSERFMGAKWVLHDVGRAKAAVYDGADWIMTDAPAAAAKIDKAEKEDEYRDLWTVFYNTLAIKERTNPRQQRQMKPMFMRKYMTEHRHIDPRLNPKNAQPPAASSGGMELENLITSEDGGDA